MNFKIVIFTIFFFILIQYSQQSFQDDLLTNILQYNENSNIMISPLGIYQILSILANGADGETQKEILDILYPNEKKENLIVLDEINNNIIEILSNLSKGTNFTTINNNNLKENKNLKLNDITNNLTHYNKDNINFLFDNINNIFINNKYKVTNKFSLLCKNYNIYIHKLIDLNQINNFCSNNTIENINSIIEKREESQSFLLINQIYFRGSWKIPFIKDKTKKLQFLNNNNNLVQVDTMYAYFKEVMYYKDDNVQMISLPYITEKLKFKMIIILPNNTKYSSSLNYLKEENINLNNLISKLKLTKSVNLYLPKFDYKFNISLNKELHELNMKKAFTANADFGKIFNIKSIKIDEITHKTYIKINEEGTETKPVIEVKEIYNSGGNTPEEINMHVNHSFIYMIVCDEMKDSQMNHLMPIIGVVNILKENKTNIENNNIINNKLYNDFFKTNINKLNKSLEPAYIRTNEKKNLTVIHDPINYIIDENNTNNTNSSSNIAYRFNSNKININIFIIILVLLSIDYN